MYTGLKHMHSHYNPGGFPRICAAPAFPPTPKRGTELDSGYSGKRSIAQEQTSQVPASMYHIHGIHAMPWMQLSYFSALNPQYKPVSKDDFIQQALYLWHIWCLSHGGAKTKSALCMFARNRVTEKLLILWNDCVVKLVETNVPQIQ